MKGENWCGEKQRATSGDVQESEPRGTAPLAHSVGYVR